MRRYFTYCILLHFATAIHSKEVFYDLKVSYFDGAPDGVPKRILGFNEQFPGPTLRATKNDILTVKITNLMQDHQTTTIHWHGFEQFLTPFQDGPKMLTQCDIPYNSSYTYSFQVIQSGTYWYHSHSAGQLTEGLWGVIIIDNTPEVHAYDGEFLLVYSDWFHIPVAKLAHWYEDNSVSKGGMPFTDSSLLNGEGYYPCEYANKKNMSCNPNFAQRYKVLEVERGKTYRIRIVNPATTLLWFFSIDGHKLEMIETDGVDTVRVPGVDRCSLSTGTRNSFLVKMDGDLDQYWIRSTASLNLFHLDHPNINPFPEAHINNPTVLAVLKYKDTPPTDNITPPRPLINPGAVQGRPERHDPQIIAQMLQMGTSNYLNYVRKRASIEKVNGLEYYDDDPMYLPHAMAPFPITNATENGVVLDYYDCHPFGGERAPMHVNQTIILHIPDIDDPYIEKKTGFNNMTYNASSLDKPALIKLINGETIPSSLYPITINGFGEDYVVELIINDYGEGGHPFHLHGHTFWVMGYGGFNVSEGPFVEERDRQKLKSGVRRETMAVFFDSWMVIRFRADNPGLWLFHCHMNFHFDVGLGLVFVEGAEVVRQMYNNQIPSQTVDLCRQSGIDLVPNNGSPGTVFSFIVSLCGFFTYVILSTIITLV